MNAIRHDPSTIAFSDGKYFTFGTDGGGPKYADAGHVRFQERHGPLEL